MTADALGAQRRRDALDHALGPVILAALADATVVEILANPDGRIVLDRTGRGREDTGHLMAPGARERVIRLVADHVGEPVLRDDPRLSGILPSGERFQGFLPPVCAQPTFSIRKRPGVIWTLSDYVRDGVMRQADAETIAAAARERRNIVISGEPAPARPRSRTRCSPSRPSPRIGYSSSRTPPSSNARRGTAWRS